MNLISKYPIHDLNGELLVSAGTELTPVFMKELCARNPHEHEPVHLLRYGTILQDLMRQFTIPPYDIIFQQEKSSVRVLEVMEKIRLPVPILQAMDYFRDNDFHTYRHMLMISALTTMIIQEIDPKYSKLHEYELTHLGPFHDIGKIVVPLEILLKKTPLTHGELELLEHHALAGYVLISYYMKDDKSFAALVARDHHERRNGTGYPTGMLQRNLIVEITAVCDMYDALIAQRPYRKESYENRTAIEELTLMAQRGDIGWSAVQVLVAYNRHDKPNPLDVEISHDKRGKEPDNNFYRKFAD